MKKLIIILFCCFSFHTFIYAEEICETSSPEIIIDLGGDPEPEKIVYTRDTICEGSGLYCGAMGCALDVYDDGNELNYLTDNDWYIRPSESSYKNPTDNAFELIIPMAKSFCLENHGNENCSRVVKVRNNKLSVKIEVNLHDPKSTKADNPPPILPLLLKTGVNEYEANAVFESGMINGEVFEFYLDDRYARELEYVSVPEVRTNIDYLITFLAATVDLDDDGVFEVVVEMDAPYNCGVDGCFLSVLKLKDSWQVADSFSGEFRDDEFMKKYNFKLVAPAD